jgi:hypothetical protein
LPLPLSRAYVEGLKVLLVIGCLALGIAASDAAVPVEAVKSRAALRLVDGDPVTLKGVRFAARERVRLVVEAGAERRVRFARATRAGWFVASFDSLVFDRCLGFRAFATGARGSAASLKLPEPACPPGL